MKFFENDIKLGLRDLDFEGIKIRENKSRYPWKSSKEASELFDSLIEEGSELSEMRYNTLMRIQFEEALHVNISRSFVSKITSFVLMGIAIILGIYVMPIPALVFLGLSFGFYKFSKFFNRKANEEYMGMEMNSEFVKLLFAERYNK